MDNDFILKLVRPRVADQMNFDLTDSFNSDIFIGTSVSRDIGRPGIFDPHGFLGVYRTANFATGKRVQKLPFYRPKNPRSTSQTTNRSNFRLAALAWSSLSDEDKMMYNRNARPMSLTGCNLFMKQYLNNL